MKKLSKSLWLDLPPTKIYFEDLEEIIDILKEVSDKIEIKTKDYEVDTIEELKEFYQGEINYLKLLVIKPYILIEIFTDNSVIYIDKDSLSTRGMLEKIKQIFRRDRYKLLWFADESIGKTLSSLSLIVLLYFFLFNRHYSFIIVIGVFTVFEIIQYIYALKIKNRIFLTKKTDKKSFWKRKKDDIILSLISAILGAAVGAIITFIFIKVFN